MKLGGMLNQVYAKIVREFRTRMGSFFWAVGGGALCLFNVV